MVESKPRGRGRPTVGERVPLGLRVTPEMKEQLDTAANRSGRSQSQEAEFRLQRTFDQDGLLPEVMALGFGRQLAGLVILIAYSMERAGRVAAWEATRDLACWQSAAWLQNPPGYDAAVKAAVAVLEAARPPGDRHSPLVGAGTVYTPFDRNSVAALLSGGSESPHSDDVCTLLGPDMVKRIKGYKPAETGSANP